MATGGNNDDDGKVSRRRARPLTEEENKLWRAVVKDAKPLPRRRRKPAVEIPLAEAAELAAIVPPPIRTAPAAPLPPKAAKTRAPEPPLLTGLDRRVSQRLARGQMEVEATLDLHGHSQHEAHEALLSFLSRSRARGLRCLLVITGKGASPYARHTLHGASFYEVPERQGVLRSAVPRWLEEAAFRIHLSGFQPAHPKHGGGGAFYIWLRRKR
ncbi:Smr/MutS family protein [uncultured Parvibaculum sp.]|uniref:Smr/MutS family protein n=1 Tax=uncultured Parvibaculum sp. TaxID=291828 RepID=UPI0030D74FE2|tara:strand:+ start:52639 stop:53277 length:639 start_codon:yes stop_codon:yes gene_type:complete